MVAARSICSSDAPRFSQPLQPASCRQYPGYPNRSWKQPEDQRQPYGHQRQRKQVPLRRLPENLRGSLFDIFSEASADAQTVWICKTFVADSGVDINAQFYLVKQSQISGGSIFINFATDKISLISVSE